MGEDTANHEMLFLSTAPVRPSDRRAAVVFVLLSLVVCAAAVRYAAIPWPQIPAFIPAYEAALVICDLITAVLLLGQFREVRTRSLLILGSGYLFTALMALAHALSFPGLFAPHGLFGDSQTTVWLYIQWHAVFPLCVVAYALMSGENEPRDLSEKSGTMLVAMGATISAAVAMAAAAGTPSLLPVLMDEGSQLPAARAVLVAIWLLPLLPLAILATKTRFRRVLDLWLGVVMAAWLLDVLLSAVLVSARYQVGFYVGRLYGLLAASFVLVVLLYETVGLYGRLARSLADAREKAAALARSEAALRQAQKMEAIGKLTGGVAHEFNNLLTVVIGSLDVIIESRLGEPLQRMAATAMGAAQRGGRLTSQLLMFARKQVMQPETVNLNRLLLDFEGLVRRAVGGAVALEIRFDPGLDPAHIDAAQFEAAVLNLVMNARDAVAAMKGAGMIVLETRNARLGVEATMRHPEARPGDYAVIAVRDNGEGIAPDVLTRVFDPFFTTREVGKGTGLGLSQVYGFAKESGGHVEIESAVGRGTTVELWLPRAVPAARLGVAEGEAGARDPAPLRPAGAGEVVLVVEDDLDVLTTAVVSLNGLGYRTLVAQDARAALALIDSGERVDILFSDVVMPGGMNGAQLAAAARQRRPKLKVLLTSGYTTAALTDQQRGERLPADVPLLHKPYRREELAQTLQGIRRSGA
jgi:signal transduction histidine kinase/CheY-like chemotaxis protein